MMRLMYRYFETSNFGYFYDNQSHWIRKLGWILVFPLVEGEIEEGKLLLWTLQQIPTSFIPESHAQHISETLSNGPPK